MNAISEGDDGEFVVKLASCFHVDLGVGGNLTVGAKEVDSGSVGLAVIEINIAELLFGGAVFRLRFAGVDEGNTGMVFGIL
jgi:hypothetical protein